MVRKATTSDISQMVGLLNILFTQELEFTPDLKAHTFGLETIINNPKIGIILVYELENKIVGMVNILFTVSTALGKKVAILEDMIVDDQLRGTGIGSKLIKEAILLSKRNNVARITLLTDSTNENAIKFYKKTGFEISQMVPLRMFLEDSF